MLCELLEQDRIETDDANDSIVSLKSALTTGDPILDEILTKIADSSQRKSLTHWINAA